jgi:hypothetical protein
MRESGREASTKSVLPTNFTVNYLYAAFPLADAPLFPWLSTGPVIAGAGIFADGSATFASRPGFTSYTPRLNGTPPKYNAGTIRWGSQMKTIKPDLRK